MAIAGTPPLSLKYILDKETPSPKVIVPLPPSHVISLFLVLSLYIIFKSIKAFLSNILFIVKTPKLVSSLKYI